MSSFNVTITSKKGDEVTVSVPKSGTVKDLKLAYMKSAAKTPKDIHQISFKNDKNEKMKFNDNNALIKVHNFYTNHIHKRIVRIIGVLEQ